MTSFFKKAGKFSNLIPLFSNQTPLLVQQHLTTSTILADFLEAWDVPKVVGTC